MRSLDHMTHEVRFFRCPRCRHNHPARWMLPPARGRAPEETCPAFVRGHWHLDGACRRWAGLRQEDPLACDVCGRSLVPFVVIGRLTEATCGGVCRSARGPACDCSCGGANHGVS